MAKLTMYAIAMKLMPKNDFDHKQKGKKMDNIKILVACHKPSVLPKSHLPLSTQMIIMAKKPLNASMIFWYPKQWETVSAWQALL